MRLELGQYVRTAAVYEVRWTDRDNDDVVLATGVPQDIEGRGCTIRTAWGQYKLTARPDAPPELVEYTRYNNGAEPVACVLCVYAPLADFQVRVDDDGTPLESSAELKELGSVDRTLRNDEGCPPLNARYVRCDGGPGEMVLPDGAVPDGQRPYTIETYTLSFDPPQTIDIRVCWRPDITGDIPLGGVPPFGFQDAPGGCRSEVCLPYYVRIDPCDGSGSLWVPITILADRPDGVTVALFDIGTVLNGCATVSSEVSQQPPEDDTYDEVDSLVWAADGCADDLCLGDEFYIARPCPASEGPPPGPPQVRIRATDAAVGLGLTHRRANMIPGLPPDFVWTYRLIAPATTDTDPEVSALRYERRCPQKPVEPPVIDPLVGLASVAGDEPDPPPDGMRGVGDLIERGTRAFGVKPCGGCKKRRDTLNRWFPFG